MFVGWIILIQILLNLLTMYFGSVYTRVFKFHLLQLLVLVFWCFQSWIGPTQPANIGPQDVPRTSLSNLSRTFPKDPIWPSRQRPNLTSWGRPEMLSRGLLTLTFKGRPWEVDSGHPQDVVRTSPRGPWEYSELDV